MEQHDIDSSGTEDDNPHPQYSRAPLGGGRVGGRSFKGTTAYQRMQIDMEAEIHSLEQIAYSAVLRAFKAQSDALTWEKEGLITELRKELRVSDDEHRKLLSEVNADNLICKIREWREMGGSQNAAFNFPPHGTDLQSPTVSASRKKQKAANPFGRQPLSVAATAQPLSSGDNWGNTPRTSTRLPNSGQPALTHDLAESVRDPLIGRRVMIRWPGDNNFYEAAITEYNPADGRHSLVYDSNTPNASSEWVNLEEIPPEDIRWVGDDPMAGQMTDEAGPGGMISVPNAGRSTASTIDQIPRSENGVVQEDSMEFEILDTEILLKKVEKVLHASNPDLLEIRRAKKMVKDHEQSLVDVIARLNKICEKGN